MVRVQHIIDPRGGRVHVRRLPTARVGPTSKGTSSGSTGDSLMITTRLTDTSRASIFRRRHIG